MASRSSSIDLWPARALFVGPLASVAEHRHGAGAFLVGLDRHFELRAGAAKQACRWALVPAETSHSLECGGGRVAVLYLFAESGEYRQLCEQSGAGGRPVTDAPALAELASLLHGFAGERAAARDVSKLERTLAAPAPRVDARIARAMQLFESSDALSLAQIATRVGLSESRLQHLFREVTGVTPRRYRIWQRMRRLTALVGAGASLTRAAHASGFADSSHLAHAYRTNFGLAPSRVLSPACAIVRRD